MGILRLCPEQARRQLLHDNVERQSYRPDRNPLLRKAARASGGAMRSRDQAQIESSR
jgi:hypothetical protein